MESIGQVGRRFGISRSTLLYYDRIGLLRASARTGARYRRYSEEDARRLELVRLYRAADLCYVSSLHDGMNLVAKEYVAARDDERGALVLSQFTGAAHELHEALIVNPYHIEQTADAIYRALTMPEFEQRERMRSMRALVRDFNVYRWAGRMLLDAARVRQREKLASRIGRES